MSSSEDQEKVLIRIAEEASQPNNSSPYASPPNDSNGNADGTSPDNKSPTSFNATSAIRAHSNDSQVSFREEKKRLFTEHNDGVALIDQDQEHRICVTATMID